MNKKILLVEDDELDIISVQRSLKKLNFEHALFIAYNGREALNMLTDEKNPLIPDVILLDLNMPKMNGIEFLKIIRSNGILKHIKVFMMTTSGEIVDRNTAEQLGISGYMIKPLSYSDNSKKSESMDSFVAFHLRKILSEE
jgi:CheY-like chemotaxis protein